MVEKHAGKMAGVLVLLILAGFGLTYWREIWAVLAQPQARDAFIEFVRGKGVLGVFYLLDSSFFRWWWLSCPVKRLNSLRAFLRHLGRAVAVPFGHSAGKLHRICFRAPVRRQTH